MEMIFTKTWPELRKLFKDVDRRVLLDILGRLGDVEEGTLLAIVEEDEDNDDPFADFSSSAYEMVLWALYSLGVVQPVEGYEMPCDADVLEVKANTARILLLAVAGCDAGEMRAEIAPREMVEAFKGITRDVEDREAAGEMRFLSESGEFHNAKYGDVTKRKHMADLTDAELSKVAMRVLGDTFGYRYSYPVVLAEVARRWMKMMGMKP